jgi:AcrR family transcriptional regulator
MRYSKKQAAMRKPPRLSSDDRREQILAVATEILGTVGLANISMEGLARECGVSKALIYVHFPAISAVLDGVAQREFEALDANGLGAALMFAKTDLAATRSAHAYFQHVSLRGSVLHMLLINPSVSSQFSSTTRAMRDGLLRRVAGRIRDGMGLCAHDAVAAAVLLTSIPERAGRMVAEGEIDMKTGAQLCALLTTTTLQALASTLNGRVVGAP